MDIPLEINRGFSGRITFVNFKHSVYQEINRARGYGALSIIMTATTSATTNTVAPTKQKVNPEGCEDEELLGYE